MVIISPYEAQALIRKIKASRHVTLHLYAPRINMNQKSLDHLNLYTVPVRQTVRLPRSLIVMLNIFAGQLYLRSFEEYTQVCDALGLAWDDAVKNNGGIEADGFIPPDQPTGALVNRTRFTRSPTKFLLVFLTTVRQNNQNIDKTHMGRLLNGNRLTRAHFGEQDEAGDETAEGAAGILTSRIWEGCSTIVT